MTFNGCGNPRPSTRFIATGSQGGPLRLSVLRIDRSSGPTQMNGNAKESLGKPEIRARKGAHGRGQAVHPRENTAPGHRHKDASRDTRFKRTGDSVQYRDARPEP